MEKLKMQTADGVQDNISRIAELFPECITEVSDKMGGVKRSVDFDKLRQLLSSEVVEGNEERYQFTWPDKRKAILAANAPINATLRPCREESVDFDTTQNLYIEGDNLDVLKCLKETYLHKVKMIYIDPPYNTGNDFVYEDDFAESASEYLANSGQFDEQGNRLVTNTESNGRFHTDWLNMIYPRLRVARDLLTEDGVIFISIDDNEVENLRKACDEVFGEGNFITQIVWERAFAPINLKKHFSVSHDYILCVAKNVGCTKCNGLPRDEKSNSRYINPDNDPRGPWQSDNSTVGPAIPNKVYEIISPSGRSIMPPSGRCWLYTKDRFQEMIADNRIWFGEDGNNVPRVKRFLSEVKSGLTPMSIWKYSEVGHSQEATQKLKELFNGHDYFDYPKPVELIKRCILLYSDKDSLILDFFSGSATTAHAVMQLNAEDGGNRKFIMVQLPELTDEKSEAYKAGYKNICEIGKERIRRAGAKIKADNPEKAQHLDTGFRVLKLDSSNMKDVFYSPKETEQQDLFALVDNVKPDRTSGDLLFQVMLELGATLDSKIEESMVDGKTIYNVGDGYLVACFDQKVSEDVVKAIAKMQPMYAVLRDTSMADDATATNFEQIFKTYAPNTTTKIL